MKLKKSFKSFLRQCTKRSHRQAIEGRNLRNTSRGDFNCAGYALGSYDRYCPESYCCINLQRPDKEGLERCVLDILKDFPTLRRVSTVDEVRHTEAAIAFRIGDGDFHFMRRGKNGIWYHKAGTTYPIHKAKKEEVFSGLWCGRYNGEIAFFAQPY